MPSLSEAPKMLSEPTEEIEEEINDKDFLIALARERLKLCKNRRSCENSDMCKSICVTADTAAPQQVSGRLLARMVIGYKAGVFSGRVGIALLTLPAESKLIVFKEVKGYNELSMLKRLTVNIFNARQPLKVFRQGLNVQFLDNESISWRLQFRTEADKVSFFQQLNGANVKLLKKPPSLGPVEKKPKMEKIRKCVEPSTTCTLGQELNNALKLQIKKELDNQEVLQKQNQKEKVSESKVQSDTEMKAIDTYETHARALPDIQIKIETLTDDESDSTLVTDRQPTEDGFETETDFETETETGAQGGTETNSELETEIDSTDETETETDDIDNVDGDQPAVRADLEAFRPDLVVNNQNEIDQGSSQSESDDYEDEQMNLQDRLLELEQENRKLQQEIQERTNQELASSLWQMLQKYTKDFAEIGISDIYDFDILLETLITKALSFKEKMLRNEERANNLFTMLASLKTNVCDMEQKRVNATKKVAQLEQLTNRLQREITEKNADIVGFRNQLYDAEQLIDMQSEKHQQQKMLMQSMMNNLGDKILEKLENVEKMKKEAVFATIKTTIRQETRVALRK